MPVSLVANQYPSGTLQGSPIKVVDTYSANGTEDNFAVPISAKAQPGDLILAWLGRASQVFGTAGIGTTPASDILTRKDGTADGASGAGVATCDFFYRVVTQNDIGKSAYIQWSGATNFFSVAVIVYCLRYVDSVVIFDSLRGFNTSGGVTNVNTGTGSVTTSGSGWGSLIVGAIAADAGNPGLGIGAGPLPGWYQTIDANGGAQPNLGLVSGIVSMPYAARAYQGAGCQWGSPAVPAYFVGFVQPLRPTPAPTAPVVSLNPGGDSVDMAGVTGTPFAVSWAWTPVRGQGVQLSWLIGRQVHGSATNVGYWNGDTNTWSATEYWNYGAISSFAFPANAWENDGTQWDLFVAVTESNLFLKSGLSTARVVTAANPPAVTAVTITNPGTTTPTINWAENLPVGPQTGYRVKVFSAAQLALPGFKVANMLPPRDYDFEGPGNTGSWFGVNLGGGALTIAQDTAHPFIGTGNLKFTFAAASGNVYSGRYSVTGGVAYTASAYFFADTVARSVTMGLQFYDAAGNFLIELDGLSITDSTSTWVKATTGNWTAPAGAANVNLVLNYPSAAAAEVHRIDAVELMATPAPVWESGLILGTAVSATTAALAPSVQYTAYVSVWQQGDQQSPWAPLTYTDGRINAPTATWFAALTAAPVPAAPVATATVGGL